MDLGVAGQAFVLIGGSRGMGWETARRLAAAGAHVAIVSRSAEGAQAAVRRLQAEFGTPAAGFAADAAAEGELDRAVDAAVAALGSLAGLLVTTGATRSGDRLDFAADETWEASFQDVLMSAVRATRAGLRHLRGAGGSIVTTAAYTAGVPQPERFGYAALKAAVTNLTKNIALTYGPDGVRANCVCPGAIETERSAARIATLRGERGFTRPEAERHLMEQVFRLPVALQRIGQPGEVADLMAFLLSRRAGYLTGATINIDGGTAF